MQNFDTPTPISAVLDVPAGRLQLIAADRADTTVEIRPADASKGRDVKAAEQARVVFADGVLRIEATAKSQLLGPSGALDVPVAEAHRGSVVLTTQAGNVSVDAAPGVSAALDAGTTYGRIHNSLKNSDGAAVLTIRATTAQGDITARSL